MPKETFWGVVDNANDMPEAVLTVTWGADHTGAFINGMHFEESALERLRTALTRALGKDRTTTVTLVANVKSYVDQMELATLTTRALKNELLECGIKDADIPEAITTALKLDRSE